MGQERIKEFKIFPMELKADDNLQEGEFIGRSSIFGNVDYWNDIVVVGAFKQTLRGNKRRPLYFMHTPFETVGIAENQADDEGLRTHGKYNMAVSDAVDVYEFHKQGAYGDLSIGYTAVKFEYETRKGVRIRLLKEVQLFEVSILPIGYAANPKAFVTELKTRNMIKGLSDKELLELLESKKDDTEFVNKILSLFTEPGTSTQCEKPIDVKTGKPELDYFLAKFNEGLNDLNTLIKEV